jgi:hypothetical protein
VYEKRVLNVFFNLFRWMVACHMSVKMPRFWNCHRRLGTYHSDYRIKWARWVYRSSHVLTRIRKCAHVCICACACSLLRDRPKTFSKMCLTRCTRCGVMVSTSGTQQRKTDFQNVSEIRLTRCTESGTLWVSTSTSVHWNLNNGHKLEPEIQ